MKFQEFIKITESINLFKTSKVSQKDFNTIIESFLLFAKKELNLKKIPKINLTKDSNFAKEIGAFGRIKGKDNIMIDVLDRHPMDILRTIAHELVHYQQHERNQYGSGHAGSVTEDEANAKAGELIRKFGNSHSQFFKLSLVNEH